MGSGRPSMQDLIRRRRHAGFIGRRDELASYRDNFTHPPEDERHRFLFHIHGAAGVGKTSLVRRLEESAREGGALVAYVDEAVNSVPEAMAAISAQFAQQGHEFKALDRHLSTYRQRRHEAESATVAPDPGSQSPSAGSMIAAQAGLFALGSVPFVGGFAGAVQPAQLAQGADRLRSALSSRLRNQDDVQLVMDPLQALTPVLVHELTEAAAAAPWIALFFDTYERTGPLLDRWIRDLMTSDRYGSLPANTVVTLAGQGSLDARCWADFVDVVEDMPLERFTEEEARRLLTGKGITDERVVEVVLRLSGRLPVLVSALAENQPMDPGAVGDPSGTAVERFLKWEQDPVRRAAALAGALPRELNDDVFRVAVEAEGTELFAWLRELPFIRDRSGRAQYHDVVRAPMLRLQRTHSPRRWSEAHTRLAEAFGGWREEAGTGLDEETRRTSTAWRELRLEEAYHQLCANPRIALPAVLRELVDVCDKGGPHVLHWARMIADAGEDSGAAEVAQWGTLCTQALAEEANGTTALLTVLLSGAEFDTEGRTTALLVRARDFRDDGAYARALRDYEAALALTPDSARAFGGRGVSRKMTDDYEGALTDLDRSLELADDAWFLAQRGELHWICGRNEEAVADLDRAFAADPEEGWVLAMRGMAAAAAGRSQEGLADLDRAAEQWPEYLWIRVQRASARIECHDFDGATADLDRVFELAPESAWIASERGDGLRLMERYEEADAELGRALTLKPDYPSVLASRGVVRRNLDRLPEALEDLDRAIVLKPDYTWALVNRAKVRRMAGDEEGATADLDSAVAVDDEGWSLTQRGIDHLDQNRGAEAMADFGLAIARYPFDKLAWAHRGAEQARLGRYAEAFADLDRAIEIDPPYGWALLKRARLAAARGRPGLALGDLTRCAATGHSVDFAQRRRAELLLVLGRPEEALTVYSDAAPAQDPASGWLQVAAVAHRMAGRLDLAAVFARRMADADPVWGRFQQAMTSMRRRETEQAAEHWHALGDRLRNPPEGSADDPVEPGLAMVCFGLGRFEEAIALLAEAMAATGEDAPDWEDLSDFADALTELRTYSGLDPAQFDVALRRVTEARDAIARS
ncbi:ATP-binding protein [Streptomyces beijiangensis]|uniref:Tetratricopeptide repeat protein n=1 Tax=Streptomyces beijiangensis TaxID=163361 RepID=A0A939F8M1_9ACTN|nr:ATP-binding protein [Streptomyces beijiangensis]MBO0514072.1 tetratricopeptide repeat protein [Streptomyces beijiangensis]